MATPNYGLGDYDAEAQDIERRRKYAEMLQQQSMEPIQQQTAGGWVTPVSWTQGLAKALQGLSGSMGQAQANQQQRSLAERMGNERQQTLAKALQMAQGTPEMSSPGAEIMGSGPDVPAAPGNLQGAYGVLAGSRDPGLQQIGLSGSLAALQPKAPIKLGAGESLISPTTMKPVYTAPPKPEAFTLAPGATRYGSDGRPIVSAPDKKDEFTRTLEMAGIDPNSDEGKRLVRARLEKETTHPAAPNVKVDVKTGESLGKEIGPMVAESRAGALGALQTAEIANRVRQSIAGGNVNLGPTATIRNSIDQLAQTMGIAGQSTEERLVNTREVIRGLAQATVAARKQLKGQGQVSDFEGKLLQKAESGEIDNMTMPELKSFMNLSERLAKLQYDQHTHNVDVMRRRPDLTNLVDFYQVPEWKAFNAPEQAPPQAAPRGAPKVIKFKDLK